MPRFGLHAALGATVLAAIVGCANLPAGLAFRPPQQGPIPDRSAFANLTPAQQGLAAEARQRALEAPRNGGAAVWYDPAQGVAGGITPIRSWQPAPGVRCRDFREVLYRNNGADADIQDTACRFWGKWTLLRPLPRLSRPPSLREVQQRLREVRYYGGPVNGSLGQPTRTALLRLQKDAGIPQTGEPTPITLLAMGFR